MTQLVYDRRLEMCNRNTLASYTLVRNPQGLLNEITINTEHYVERNRMGER